MSPPFPLRRTAAIIVLPYLIAVGAAHATGPSPPLRPRDFNSQSGVRVVAHVSPVAPAPDCRSVPVAVCDGVSSGFSVQAPLSTPAQPEFFVYVVAVGLESQPGFAGVQFGIQYDDVAGQGVDVLDWTTCSVLEFPMENWPHSGTGNLLTWFPDDPRAPVRCTRRGQVVIGCFTVSAYSPDLFDITERPADGMLKVADCGAAETWLDPTAAGAVGFGGVPGDDPCRRAAPPVIPLPPDMPSPWNGMRLTMNAVPIVAGDPRPTCAAAPRPACEVERRTLRSQVPLSGDGTADAWVYINLDDPQERIYFSTWFRLRYPPALQVTDWFFCTTLAGSVYNGWPASGGDASFPMSAAYCWPLDDMDERMIYPRPIVALRVHATGPGELEVEGVHVSFCSAACYFCGDEEDLAGPAKVGGVGFGTAGTDPCYRPASSGIAPNVPVKPATWGEIKTLFR